MLQQVSALLLLLFLTISSVSGSSDGAYFHQLDSSACPVALRLTAAVQPENRTVTLLMMESSRDFIPPDVTVDGSLYDKRHRPCYYQGGVAELQGDDAASAVGKLADGWFSATFSHNGAIFEISSQPAGSRQFLAHRMPPRLQQRFSCGLRRGDAAEAPDGGRRSSARLRRAIADAPAARMDLHSPVPEDAQKFVSLMLVGDEAFVNGTGGSVVVATERLWEIGNYINNFYKPIGVNVVTVRVVTLKFDALNLGKNASSDPSVMLANFMLYRMQYLADTVHSAAHLVSGLTMTGANVGLANYGKLCQFPLAGGVNTDTAMNGSALSVAVTITHELGHNLGMEHDPDGAGNPCGCQDSQGCIMQAVGGEVIPFHFSNCSLTKFRAFSAPNGIGYCMTRPPAPAVLAGLAPRCGNRVVEAGEDCDCGSSAFCNNSCCDPSTCRFASGASCASGSCCNVTSCSLLPKGTACRAARGVCDLPEFCNGTSEWCPDLDDYKTDGSPCATNSTDPSQAPLAYCYRATCVTRDERCRALFSDADIRAASELAAARTMDASGLGDGYCDYVPKSYQPLAYAFLPCSNRTQRCGTLYCAGAMPTGFPTSVWTGLDSGEAKSILPSEPTEPTLAYVRLDLRISGYRDPGLVPDGAECGLGMMCVNSDCVSASAVRANATAAALPGTANCSGNGVLAQSGLCFCNVGFRPPDCSAPGIGGSIANQPAGTDSATVVPPVTDASSTTLRPVTTTRVVNPDFTTVSSTVSGTLSGTLSSTERPVEQKRDYFWIYLGVGLSAFLLLLFCTPILAWLCLWCRRNSRAQRYSVTLAIVMGPGAAWDKPFRTSPDPGPYPGTALGSNQGPEAMESFNTRL